MKMEFNNGEDVVQDISRNPDTDLTRNAPTPIAEDLLELAQDVPYAIGAEFVDVN